MTTISVDPMIDKSMAVQEMAIFEGVQLNAGASFARVNGADIDRVSNSLGNTGSMLTMES